MLSLTGRGPRVILTDSLGKYVKVLRVVVKAFPGETVTKLTDRIRVGLGGYHPAWENTGSRRYQRCGWLVEVQENKVSDTIAGPEKIKGVERGYFVPELLFLIPFPSILPKLNQFRKFNPYVLGLNFALEKCCTHQVRRFLCVYPIVQELPGRQRTKGRIVCQGWTSLEWSWCR